MPILVQFGAGNIGRGFIAPTFAAAGWEIIFIDVAPAVIAELNARRAYQVIAVDGVGEAAVTVAPVRAIDGRDLAAVAAAVAACDLAATAVGIVPPMSWAHNAKTFRFTRDLDKARALLDEAGYPDPDGAGPQPRLRLSLKTSTAEAYRLQAAVLQQQLSEVGIALELRSYEFATLFADVIRGNVQLYTLQWVGVTDPDMLRRVFHSAQVPPAGFNRGYYKNPEVDRLIDAATESLDEPTRLALYAEVQEILARDAPYISLWYKTNVVVAQSHLTGIRLSPTAEFTFLQFVAPRSQ